MDGNRRRRGCNEANVHSLNTLLSIEEGFLSTRKNPSFHLVVDGSLSLGVGERIDPNLACSIHEHAGRPSSWHGWLTYAA